MLTSVQKVRFLPGYDRFHLVAVHTEGNLETLIFHIDFPVFVQSVRKVRVKNQTSSGGVKPVLVHMESSKMCMF